MSDYGFIRVKADAVILVIGGGFTTPTPARELGLPAGWLGTPDNTMMDLTVYGVVETPLLVSGQCGGFTLVVAREDLVPRPAAAAPPP